MDAATTKTYSHPLFQSLDYSGHLLMRVNIVFFELIGAIIIPTSQERANRKHPVLLTVCTLPVYLVFYSLTLPFMLIGFPIWVIPQYFRLPYKLHHGGQTLIRGTDIVNKQSAKDVFTLVTANVCLFTDIIIRLTTNLSNRAERLKMIGQSLQQSQRSSREEVKVDGAQGQEFDHDIRSQFPHVDIIGFQEVIGIKTNHNLKEILKSEFPYIVYDVGLHRWNTNCYYTRHGLVLASRYPIMSVAVHHFTTRAGVEGMISLKGCLQIKVHLGLTKDEKKAVGYVLNTHLQSFQGEGEDTHPSQLDDILRWQAEFKTRNSRDDEVVLFDVIMGDFNFDNVDPASRKAQNHRIFNQYIDLNREKAGVEKPWARGTCIFPQFIYEPCLQTPSELKRILQDVQMQLQYFYTSKKKIDSNVGTIYELIPGNRGKKLALLNTEDDVSDVPQRIDHILPCTELPTQPVGFFPVTQFAGMTDHIALCLQLKNTLE